MLTLTTMRWRCGSEPLSQHLTQAYRFGLSPSGLEPPVMCQCVVCCVSDQYAAVYYRHTGLVILK